MKISGMLAIPAFLSAGFLSTNAMSQDAPSRSLQGVGWLLTDDLFGDGEDRWHTASLTLSWVFADSWDGELPMRFGDLIEVRAYSEVISPKDLTIPDPSDRPYAGILGFGAFTHFQSGQTEIALGGEIVATGPDDLVGKLQTEFHELIGSRQPSDLELSQQIPDGLYPTFVGEVGRSFQLGDAAYFRPFAELRVGDETLGRVGFDATFGHVGQAELLIRDKGTGQRYRTVRGGPRGVSGILGVDVAYVADTIYLPRSLGLIHETQRTRIRGGLSWQGRRTSVFYGATYLSEEFTTQEEAQVVGSLTLTHRF